MHCVPPGGMPCEAPVLLVFRVPAWRDRCGIISPACAGGSGGLSMASIPAGLCTVDSSRCNDGSRVGTPHGLVRVRRALRAEADRCNALFLGLSAAARGPARVRPRRGGPGNDRVRRERVFSLQEYVLWFLWVVLGPKFKWRDVTLPRVRSGARAPEGACPQWLRSCGGLPDQRCLETSHGERMASSLRSQLWHLIATARQ